MRTLHLPSIVGADAKPLRVLGMTAQFDPEVFFGSVIVATFRTQDPANMKRYLENYLGTLIAKDYVSFVSFIVGKEIVRSSFADAWKQRETEITAAIAADPSGSKPAGPGGLNELTSIDVKFPDAGELGRVNISIDLPSLAHSQLKIFHNMRAALHIPDHPPPASPPNGPGRNDPWRILSHSLLGI
jgi:hypothetical protein